MFTVEYTNEKGEKAVKIFKLSQVQAALKFAREHDSIVRKPYQNHESDNNHPVLMAEWQGETGVKASNLINYK